jgi:S-adenosylmethionine decarboxylase
MSAQIAEYQFAGIHFLASYMKCSDISLNDISGLKEALRNAVKASGATMLNSVDHVFDSNGYTAAIILSESHASIHTYPEFKSCFVDLFTCGDKCSHEKFHAVLGAYLKAENISYQVIKRDSDMQVVTRENNQIT